MRKFLCILGIMFSSLAQGAAFEFLEELIQHESRNISMSGIATSLIYPESKPLNMTLIHPYNPLISNMIGMRVASVKGPFEGQVGEHHVLISRPMMDEGNSLLFRPHYWVTRSLPEADIAGNTVVQVDVNVVTAAGASLLTGSQQVHVHGKVCSPANMPLALSMGENDAHLLYSSVKNPDQTKVFTCHWIPTQAQWEEILRSELEDSPFSPAIYELLELSKKGAAANINALITQLAASTVAIAPNSQLRGGYVREKLLSLQETPYQAVMEISPAFSELLNKLSAVEEQYITVSPAMNQLYETLNVINRVNILLENLFAVLVAENLPLTTVPPKDIISELIGLLPLKIERDPQFTTIQKSTIDGILEKLSILRDNSTPTSTISALVHRLASINYHWTPTQPQWDKILQSEFEKSPFGRAIHDLLQLSSAVTEPSEVLNDIKRADVLLSVLENETSPLTTVPSKRIISELIAALPLKVASDPQFTTVPKGRLDGILEKLSVLKDTPTSTTIPVLKSFMHEDPYFTTVRGLLTFGAASSTL